MGSCESGYGFQKMEILEGISRERHKWVEEGAQARSFIGATSEDILIAGTSSEPSYYLVSIRFTRLIPGILENRCIERCFSFNTKRKLFPPSISNVTNRERGRGGAMRGHRSNISRSNIERPGLHWQLIMWFSRSEGSDRMSKHMGQHGFRLRFAM